MSKIYQKISRYSFAFIPALTISFISPAFAEPMPEVYNFLPPDAIATLNIKTAEADWPVLAMNKSLKKIDLLDGLKSGKNDNPIDIILEPRVKNNIGSNLVLSLSAVDFSKDPQILMIAGMKDTSQNNYIMSSFNKMYLTKKDGKLTESTYKDIKIYSFIAKDPKNKKYEPAYLAFFNNYVLMANSSGVIQNSMKSFYKEKPGLSYASDFIKSYDKLGTDHQVQLYLNMKKIATLFLEQEKSKKPVKDKDMDFSMFKNFLSNNAMMVNFQVNPDNIDLRTYSIADKTTSYYKTMQQSKPSDFRKYTNYIPKNTLLFLGISDLKEAGQNFKTLLPASDALEIEKMFQGAIGINMFNFADNLKNDMAVAAFNTDSNPLIPGVAFFMTPKDKDKMNLMFKSLRFDINGIEKKTEKGNRKKHEAEKPVPAATEIMQFNSSSIYKNITIFQANEIPSLAEFNTRPAYAYLGEDVILASNQEAIKAVIDNSTVSAPDFSLNANDSFSKLKTAFGENNNGILFLNLSKIINMVSSFFAGEKDSREMFDNLKKFEAIGSSSINDQDGNTGHILIEADIKNIDFNKLIPEDKKPKAKNNTKRKS